MNTSFVSEIPFEHKMEAKINNEENNKENLPLKNNPLNTNEIVFKDE